MEDIRPLISPNSGRFLDQLRLHIRQKVWPTGQSKLTCIG